MSKHATALLAAALLALPAFTQERGTPIFSDTFDTPATFAENWVPKDKRIKSENGGIVFPTGGTLVTRGDTPREFYAEMVITLDMSHQPDVSKWDQAFCGFVIEGFNFFILPSGNTWMIYKLKGFERAHGKQVKIEGFELKKPVSVTLIRKVDNDVATYMFRVNGKDAGSFVFDAPMALPGIDGSPRPFKSLEIFSYNVNMTLDNFSLSAVKRLADDSPNVIINSSFEHERDAFPLYFCRSGFDLAKALTIPYEDFLSTWSLDTQEKHSGRQSLKMVFDDSMSGQVLWAWGAGTVKDQPGVFSAWMKADQEDFPVKLAYGKSREVKVGTTWKRYEVVNPTLPGAGVYSPVTISCGKVRGTLWVDDLQAEFLSVTGKTELAEGELIAEEPRATPYRPSVLDAQRFGELEAPVRAPAIQIRKLPAGLVPSGDLDTWKDKAAKLDTFYFKREPARNRTEAYLACDDDNLYIGYRCFFEDLALVNTNRQPHDSFGIFSKDSVEFFLDPTASGIYFQFAADAVGTRLDIGRGGNVAWDGEWKTAQRFNTKAKSVDYEVTVPFSTIADAAMSARWLVNICRNDSTVKEHVAVTRTPILGFKQTDFWPTAELPPEVVARYAAGVTDGAYTDDDAGTTISLTVDNLTGKDLSLNAAILDAQNNNGLLASKAVDLKKGKNDIAFRSTTKTNKIRLKLTEGDAPLADQLFALERRSAVSMLGRLSYYMNETEAVFKVSANLADVGQMTAVLSVAGQSVDMQAASEFTIAVPLKDVPDGTNGVVVALMKGKQKVAETSGSLIKRPYRAGSAQVNHFTRSLIHDGKPVFQFAPFFVFSKHQTKEYVVGAIDFIDRYGFKYLHILVDNRAVEHAVWAIGHAQEKGMKVMLWTKQNDLTDEAGEALRKQLDFPNVMAQMVMDEPELGMPSDEARAFLRIMRAKYPYHPVHMNNTVLGIPNRYADLETDILMLDDYLTNTEKRSVASVVNATDIMWEAGREEGKPCYYFVVCGNFPLHHREPSYAEQIAQTYGNIAAGCTGLSFFYGVPATPGNWKAYLQLNQEVLSLNDVLLSEEDLAQGTVTADPKMIRIIMRRHEGHVYVITCNISEKPIDTVTFTLPPDLLYADRAEVLFEGRAIPVKEGRFTDAFAGHSRHVFKVEIR